MIFQIYPLLKKTLVIGLELVYQILNLIIMKIYIILLLFGIKII